LRELSTARDYLEPNKHSCCHFIPNAFPNLEELILPFDLHNADVSSMLLKFRAKSVTLTPRGGTKISSASIVQLNLMSNSKVDITECINLRALYLDNNYGSNYEVLEQVPNLERLTVKSQGDVDPLIEQLAENKYKTLWHLEFVNLAQLKPEHLQRLVTSCQHVKKIVIKIPPCPTHNYVAIEIKARELKQFQTRVEIVLHGAEHRWKVRSSTLWVTVYNAFHL